MIGGVLPTDELLELLRSLEPVLQPGTYAFCELEDGRPVPASALGWFREAHAMTVIVEESRAADLSEAVRYRAAWIELGVDSQLSGVGLTAAVAGVLAARGISCNVVAAVRHDHLFVPVERQSEALAALRALQHWAREQPRPSQT
jgi:hypothetical protein